MPYFTKGQSVSFMDTHGAGPIPARSTCMTILPEAEGLRCLPAGKAYSEWLDRPTKSHNVHN